MHTTIRVTHEVNTLELAALLWDACMEEYGTAGQAYEAVVSVLKASEVRMLVRRQLERYGSRSVECGPKNDFPTEALEGSVRARVVNVYGR